MSNFFIILSAKKNHIIIITFYFYLFYCEIGCVGSHNNFGIITFVDGSCSQSEEGNTDIRDSIFFFSNGL